MRRFALAFLLFLMPGLAWAQTTENASKFEQYGITNRTGPNVSKFEQYSITNRTGPDLSKTEVYAIIQQAMNASKIESYAIVKSNPTVNFPIISGWP